MSLARRLSPLAAVGVLATVSPSRAEEDVFARVVVAEVELRAGPGEAHRVVHRASRGEAFRVKSRAGAGYWLQVELPDGRAAWVLGGTVERVAVGEGEEGPPRAGFFSPPPLAHANAGVGFLGGAFDADGYVELRPAWVLAPAVSFEPYAGISLRSEARRLVYGLSGTLNLAPDWAVSPYVTMGGGGVRVDPNAADDFVRRGSSAYHARAGGGLLLSLRWRISVRLEAVQVLVFTEDSYRGAQSYLGGLGSYF